MTVSAFVLGFLLLLGFSSAQYENCTTRLSVLERALYETDSNERSLNEAFFPPGQETSRYIKVTYKFLTDDGCEVSYIWSIGGFLLIQPPSVFRFTSLFFSVPANDLTEVNLSLPSQCRLLASEGEDCRCNNSEESKNLDILTQQVSTDEYCDV